MPILHNPRGAENIPAGYRLLRVAETIGTCEKLAGGKYWHKQLAHNGEDIYVWTDLPIEYTKKGKVFPTGDTIIVPISAKPKPKLKIPELVACTVPDGEEI
jgi:hypothetical protein